MSGTLLVSVHDVAPDTVEAARAWSHELSARGVPATLLVIGGPGLGADLGAWLRGRAAAGDEIALHGWTHRADVPGSVWRRVTGAAVARGAAEFWALSREEAAARLARSRDRLEAAGLPVIGFTPPGWLASAATVSAAAEAGLRYITSHLWIRDLATGRKIPAPAICHRPNSTLQAAGAGVVRTVVPFLAQRGGVVRLGLHPADREHPGLVAAALQAVDRALLGGSRPLTYAAFLAGRPAEAA